MKRISIYGLIFLWGIIFQGQAAEREVTGALEKAVEGQQKPKISTSQGLRETLSTLTSKARKLTSSSPEKAEEEAKVKPLPAGTQEADRKLIDEINDRVNTATEITKRSLDAGLAKFTAETNAKILKLQNDFKELESMPPGPVVNQLKTNTQSLIDLYGQLIKAKSKFTEGYKQWEGYTFQLKEVKQLKEDPVVYERIGSRTNLATQEGLEAVIGIFDKGLAQQNKTISDINGIINHISRANDLIKRKSVATASPIVFRSELSPTLLSALHNPYSQLIDNITQRISGLNQFIQEWNERLQQAPATLENVDYRKQVEILLNAANTYQESLRKISTELEPHQKNLALGNTEVTSEQATVIAEIPKSMDLWEKWLVKYAEQANNLAARKAVPVLPFEAPPPILVPRDLFPEVSPAAKVLPDLSSVSLKTPADIKNVRSVTAEEQANVAKTSQELVQEDRKMSPLTILSGAQQNYRRQVKLARNSAADYQKRLQDLNTELSALSTAKEDLDNGMINGKQLTPVQSEALEATVTRREKEIRAQQDALSEAQRKFAEGKKNYLKARQAVEKEAPKPAAIAGIKERAQVIEKEKEKEEEVPAATVPTPVWRPGQRLPPAPAGKPAIAHAPAMVVTQPATLSVSEELRLETRNDIQKVQNLVAKVYKNVLATGKEAAEENMRMAQKGPLSQVQRSYFKQTKAAFDQAKAYGDALQKLNTDLSALSTMRKNLGKSLTSVEREALEKTATQKEEEIRKQQSVLAPLQKSFAEEKEKYLKARQTLPPSPAPLAPFLPREVKAAAAPSAVATRPPASAPRTVVAQPVSALDELKLDARRREEDARRRAIAARPAPSPAAGGVVLPNLSKVTLTTLDDIQEVANVAAQEQKNVETVSGKLVVEDARMAAMTRLGPLSDVQQNYHKQIKSTLQSTSAYLGALQDLNNELTALSSTRHTLQEDITGRKPLNPVDKKELESAATHSEHVIREQQNTLPQLQEKFAQEQEKYLKAQQAADEDAAIAKEVNRFEVVPAAAAPATPAEEERMKKMEEEFVHVEPSVQPAPATFPALPAQAPSPASTPRTVVAPPAAAAAVSPAAATPALERVTAAQQAQMKAMEEGFVKVRKPALRPAGVPDLSVTPLQTVSDEQRAKTFAQLSTLEEPSVADIKNIRAVTVAEQANIEKVINELNQESTELSQVTNLLPAQKAYFDQVKQTLMNAQQYQKVLRSLNTQLNKLDLNRQTLSGLVKNEVQREMVEDSAKNLESEIQGQQKTTSQVYENFAQAQKALSELKTKAEATPAAQIPAELAREIPPTSPARAVSTVLQLEDPGKLLAESANLTKNVAQWSQERADVERVYKNDPNRMGKQDNDLAKAIEAATTLQNEITQLIRLQEQYGALAKTPENAAQIQQAEDAIKKQQAAVVAARTYYGRREAALSIYGTGIPAPTAEPVAAAPTEASLPAAVAGTKEVAQVKEEKEKEEELPAPPLPAKRTLPLPFITAAKPAGSSPPPPAEELRPPAPPSGEFEPVDVSAAELPVPADEYQMRMKLRTLKPGEEVTSVMPVFNQEVRNVDAQAGALNEEVTARESITEGKDEAQYLKLLKEQRDAAVDYRTQLVALQKSLTDLEANRTKLAQMQASGSTARDIRALQKVITQQEQAVRAGAVKAFSEGRAKLAQTSEAVKAQRKVIEEKNNAALIKAREEQQLKTEQEGAKAARRVAAASSARRPGELASLSSGVTAAKPADLTLPSEEFKPAPAPSKLPPASKQAVVELKGTESVAKMIEALQTLQPNENVKPLIDITIREQNTVAGQIRNIKQAIENEKEDSSSVEKELGGLLKNQQAAAIAYFEQLRGIQQLLIDLNVNHLKRDTLYSDVKSGKVAGDAATKAVEEILQFDKDIARQEEDIRNSAKEGGQFNTAYANLALANKAIKEKIEKGSAMAALEGRNILPAQTIGTLPPVGAGATKETKGSTLEESPAPSEKFRAPPGETTAPAPPKAEPAPAPQPEVSFEEQRFADYQAAVAAMDPELDDLIKLLESGGAPADETQQFGTIARDRAPDIAVAQREAAQAEDAAKGAVPGSPASIAANEKKNKLITLENKLEEEVGRLTKLVNFFRTYWYVITPIVVAIAVLPVVGIVLFKALAPADKKKRSARNMAVFIGRLNGLGVDIRQLLYKDLQAAYDRVVAAGYNVTTISDQDLLRITGFVPTHIWEPRQQRNIIIQTHGPLQGKKAYA